MTKITIPHELSSKLAGLGKNRYVRLKFHGKIPIDQVWQENPRALDDPELVAHLQEGANYGVVAGYGLVVIDLDSQQVRDSFGAALPETFTVLTPGHEGLHLYYVGSVERPIRLRDENGRNVGDIQGEGKQVVGPGSIHPNGKPYTILHDLPLAQITREQIRAVFRDYIMPETPISQASETDASKQHKIDLRIEKVIDLTNFSQHGDEYQGPHPIHGSETGGNLCVNMAENVWHCFRHDTGGGPLEWLAVSKGLVKCGEMTKGKLRGELFQQVLEVAVKDGYIKKEDVKQIKDHVIYTATVRNNVFLAEEVWNRTTDAPKFLRYTFDTGVIEEVEQIDLGEKDAKGRPIIYRPIDNEMLREGVVTVPRKATPCDLTTLLQEADNFVLGCYDPREQKDAVKLLTRVAIGSWFLDKFVKDPKLDVAGAGKFAPIIAIRGAAQSGKNRLLFCLRMIAYRPYYEVSTSRIPSLYRPLGLWKGTLCLDEADFPYSAENSEISHFLNSRAYGTPISRQDPKNPKITNIFTSFGITMLTQRRLFEDDAIHTRNLPYHSLKTIKPLPTLETDEMLQMGLDLQDKLLYLRFRFFRDFIIDKTARIEGIRDHRLISAMLPLLALSKYDQALYEDVKATIKKVEEIKVREKAISPDGVIVNYLWDTLQTPVGKWGPEKKGGYYFFRAEVTESHKGEDGKWHEETKEKALTTSIIEAQLKWKAKEVRKIIESLNLIDIEGLKLPRLIRVEGQENPAKVIFFDPKRFEIALCDFIEGYKVGELNERIGYDPDRTTLDEGEKPSLTVTTATSVTKRDENVTDVAVVTDKQPISPHDDLEQATDNPLTRLESYVQTYRSVGCTRAATDLGFSPKQLGTLVSQSGCIVMGKDVLNYRQPGDAIKFHCLACDKGDIQVDGDVVGKPRSCPYCGSQQLEREGG